MRVPVLVGHAIAGDQAAAYETATEIAEIGTTFADRDLIAIGVHEQGHALEASPARAPTSCPGWRLITVTASSSKPRYSAFDHTPLLLVLQGLGVDRILPSGGATEGRLVQTDIDARALGLKATILLNACATNDPELVRVPLAYAER